MNLTISGFSTALFSTWYFVEELGILFDAGDGVSSNLLQKSAKIKYAFISHADRDHLTGLLQLNQLNARPGFPKIIFPKDSNSIKALESFSKIFDKNVSVTEWLPIEEGEEVEIKKDVFVSAIKNNHVVTSNNIIKSCGYLVQQRKFKLKPEYHNKTQKELIALKKELGDTAITEEVRENIIAYSGDTPVQNFETWNNTDILIHEATFLYKNEIMDDERTGKHSILEDVIAAVKKIKLKVLILGHFSLRYTNDEIDNCIRECCIKYDLQIPVYRILPAHYTHNILATEPIYKNQ